MKQQIKISQNKDDDNILIKCPKCEKEYNKAKLKEHQQYDHLVEIVSRLYIGSKKLASNKKELTDNNIKYIVNCTVECKNFFPESFIYRKLPLQDSFEFPIIQALEDGANFIKESLDKNDGNVLVHCFQGKSRSASIIMAYLIKEKKMDTNEAYKLIKNKKNGILPNLGFMAQLREFEKKYINKNK